MSAWTDVLEGLAKKSGNAGIKALEGAMNGISKEAKDPWKRAIISLVGEAMSKYGPDSMAKISKLVMDAIAGKDVDLSFASLETRSDFLAAMQNLEADGKKKAKELLERLGKYIGDLIKAIIAGLCS